MKKQQTFVKAAVRILFLSTAVVLSQQQNANDQRIKDKIMPVAVHETAETPCIDYLFEIGNKLGCYFTLEYRAYALAAVVPKIEQVVSNDLAIASVPAVVSKLRRDLAGYTVVQNQKNPNIVHIVEQGLEQEKDYPLDKRISVVYSGNLAACVV